MAREQAGRPDGWSAEADPARIERDYGFSDWEPPDTGGTTRAEDFGGASAGQSGQGWDEDYTKQMESWLARPDLPEPFCLIFSLVNPHDVLGYPSSYREGGYDQDAISDLGVPLPPTIDEDLREKPAVQALSKLGMDNYLGALPRPAGGARLRELLRPPARRRRREDPAPASRARPRR